MTDQTTWKQKVKNVFTHHPHSVGETYWQHFCFASWSGLRLIFGGIACLIHSFLPFIFGTTASDTMQKITAEMNERRAKRPTK